MDQFCKGQKRKQLGSDESFALYQVRHDGGLDLGGSSGDDRKVVFWVHL